MERNSVQDQRNTTQLTSARGSLFKRNKSDTETAFIGVQKQLIYDRIGNYFPKDMAASQCMSTNVPEGLPVGSQV